MAPEERKALKAHLLNLDESFYPSRRGDSFYNLGLFYKDDSLLNPLCYAVINSPKSSSNDLVFPKSEEEFGVTISAVLVDLDSYITRSLNLVIPDSIEVIVIKNCSEGFNISLENPDSHPVFKVDNDKILETDEDGTHLVFGTNQWTSGMDFSHHGVPDMSAVSSIEKVIIGSYNKDFTIPECVSLVGSNAIDGTANSLDIQGRDTKFSRDSFASLHINKAVRINRPLHEVGHLLRQFKYNDARRYDPAIILKAPELDPTPSINPGFFRVTRRDDDNIAEVNIINVAYYSPIEFERYNGTVRGTRIAFCSYGQEYHNVLEVYESPEVVAEKIHESMGRLAGSAESIALLATRMADSIINK